MNGLPPLKSIRAFEACIRLGSFTKAALELNVGQPAISHQIQSLERDLGVALFERRGSLTVPTTEALTYHKTVAEALGSIAHASASLRKSTEKPGLTIATYPGIAMFWLMPRLSSVNDTSGEARMRVLTSERDQDIPLEDVDCAILFGEGNWPGYDSRLIMREEVVPIAAPALAETLRGRSKRDLVESGPLIHLQDRDHRWFDWASWRAQRVPEASAINSGMEVTNHGIAIHQTLMGHGVSLGWIGVISDLLENGLLVALADDPIMSERGYYLVGSKAFFGSRKATRLAQALGIALQMA